MSYLMRAQKVWKVGAETHRHLKLSRREGQCLIATKQGWAHAMMKLAGVDVEVVGEPSLDPSVLFVGNHVSYLDIPLLLRSAPKIAFVAKREISTWPIFGEGARAMNTVFVKRGSAANRSDARDSIKKALKAGQQIAIFPSGTTSTDERAVWRKGAFEVARECSAKLQPFRITYDPLDLAAFIDDDAFPTHLYRLFGRETIKARLEFHSPVEVVDPLACCDRWRAWTREHR